MNTIRYIFLCMLSLLRMSTNAQNADICGEWIGRYTFPNAEGGCIIQVALRISAHNDSYRIRMKNTNLTNGNEYKFGVCKETSSNDSTIIFRIDDPLEYDSNNEDYYSIHQTYEVKYNDLEGVLYLTQTSNYATIYDQKRQYKRQKEEEVSYYMKAIPLFNSNENW